MCVNDSKERKHLVNAMMDACTPSPAAYLGISAFLHVLRYTIVIYLNSVCELRKQKI